MILMTMKMMKVTKMMRRVRTRKMKRMMIVIPMMRMRTRNSTKVHARPPLTSGYQQCCSNYS